MSSEQDLKCVNITNTNCADCRLAAICLPITLNQQDIDQLDNIVQRGRPIQKKAYVYRAGETFRSVYAVRSGAVKTVCLAEDGVEQLTGLHLPGEVIGMDGLASNVHSNSAVALETSAICEIPFTHLEELSLKLPSLQKRLFQLFGKEIAEEQRLITMLGKKTAEERLSAFIMGISLRQGRRGLSSIEFYLPMSRSDIANYLGLTIETVSRVLTRLHKSGAIELDKKYIKILDFDALRSSPTH